jgi:hypothetical protein
MIVDLGTVVEVWKSDAAVLRRNGEARLAAVLERCAAEAEASATDWITWLSEADVVLRSGCTAKWIRHRREGWLRDGHARRTNRVWEYRAAVIPRRANVSRAADEGRSAALRVRERAA